MQQENFYNPQRKPHFNCIVVVPEKCTILCDQLWFLRKIISFSKSEKRFFLNLSFGDLTGFLKKRNISKDVARKVSESTKNSSVGLRTFCFQTSVISAFIIAKVNYTDLFSI